MTRIDNAYSLSLVALVATVGIVRAHVGLAPGDLSRGIVQQAPNFLATKIRAVDGRFADVAEAVKEGYSAIPCASGPGGGAMGVHYVNGDLPKSGKIDIAHPQAIMYEPEADGSMKLVTVGYIALKGPAALDGHLFNCNPSPNRHGLNAYYDLHVWAWRDNPTGTFSEMNPNVSCDAMLLGGN